MATTTAKKAPERRTGATGLVAWPRPARGPEPRYRWIPTSSDAAFENIRTGLDPTRFVRLISHLVAAAGIDGSRAARLGKVEQTVKAALDELDAAWQDVGRPSPRAVGGNLEASVQDLLVHAATRLSAVRRAREEQVEELMSLLGEGRQRLEHSLRLGSRTLRDGDGLARCVAPLAWVCGSDLVQVAIAVGIEKPIHGGPGVLDELERRRSVWDRRLHRARKLRDTG